MVAQVPLLRLFRVQLAARLETPAFCGVMHLVSHHPLPAASGTKGMSLQSIVFCGTCSFHISPAFDLSYRKGPAHRSDTVMQQVDISPFEADKELTIHVSILCD